MCARILLLAVLMAALSCGGAGGEGRVVGNSKIEVSVEVAPGQFQGVQQGGIFPIDPGSVLVGKTRDFRVRVTNRGEHQQRLCFTSKPELDLTGYEMPDGEKNDPDGPAFKLVGADNLSCVAPTGDGEKMGLPEEVIFTVRFKRYDDALERNARLLIYNDNTVDPSTRTYRITFKTAACTPSLDAPGTVDLGAVNKPTEESLDILNAGSCALEIYKFTFDGDPNFVLIANGKEYPVEQMHGLEQVFDPPLVVQPSSSIDPPWSIRYSPTTDDPAEARLVIYSNDATTGQNGKLVKIIANTSGPRICLEPPTVEFGGKLINKTACVDVKITSCGTGPLEVKDITLRNGATDSNEFKLDFSKMGGQASATLNVNESATLVVCYTPTDKNPVDPGTNKVILDQNEIEITSNTFKGTLSVSTTGFGVEVECPVPVIMVQEGEEVPPQTVLHLYGDQSLPSTGNITSYSWSVKQPAENKFNLVPSATFPNPTHEVNVGGEYEYCLDVCDSARCSNDAECHTTACKKVVVIPTQAIHCELTWDTPGDMDQTDEGPDAGSDMDLHFTHPFATGPDLDGDGAPDPWFNLPYDVFWFNPTPEWESMNPNAKDDPRLDRDDTDGAGPENLNLDAPVNNREYRVGVHYWDDHGYGFSYPHVRCYIWGQLVFDRDLKLLDQKMFKCDMWEVAVIKWPSGAVTEVKNPDGSLKITHKYQNPGFVQIGGGTCD